MSASKLALQAALKLAELGTPSFPCQTCYNARRGLECEKHCACKSPFPGSSSFKEATADPAGLERLWRCYPGWLVGVPTGAVSGFDVLDLDFARHKEAVEWWSANKPGIPLTRIHRTRSGGIHCLFRHDAGTRSVNGWFEDGVDVKANGGYIVWWPAHGCEIACDAPISAWPRWLIRALQPAPAPASRPTHVSGSVEHLVKFVSSLHDGQRNCGTHWAACRVWERNGSDSDLQAIVQAAMQAGLPAPEAQRVVFRQARKTVKGNDCDQRH
jgi:bifunctional DNA primase/polymerase-like protein